MDTSPFPSFFPYLVFLAEDPDAGGGICTEP